VTGAGGFVGRPAADCLRALGFDVHGVSRRRGPLVADLLNPADVERIVATVRPTHLLHLAWYTDYEHFWRSPENLRWLEASLHLVRAFAANGGRRLVMVGSCAEYASDGGVCVENQTPLAPATLYGASKHALHVAVSAFARTAGLSLAWARLFNLFGPAEQPARLVPMVIRRLSQLEPVACSDGLQVRDYLPVEDAARALALIVGGEIDGAVNVGSGTGTSVRDLAERIAALVGSPELLRFGALPRRPGEPDVQVAGIERLTREVRFTPAITLETALAQTISWWLSRAPESDLTSALRR
jgi:nucleoside-diphosphate-sugar epimerase